MKRLRTRDSRWLYPIAADTPDSYRSLDYSDNLQLLKGKGYEYLTFYELCSVDGGDLIGEPGYEHVQFLKTVYLLNRWKMMATM